MRILWVFLGCACEKPAASPPNEPSFAIEFTQKGCSEIVYHDHFLIAIVADPDAVLEWGASISDEGAWINVPEAVVLYDTGAFALTSAAYCPSGEDLRLSWLW